MIVFEGIESPDSMFLMYETSRYVEQLLKRCECLSDSTQARIVTHAPLRAREASSYVSNKYPVVVCF